MARILLGVSGGIAAYKALEFVRLATAAGHAVRVVQTRSSQRFIGTASFAALTGAPVLVSEFEHDPARGAFPGEQPPAHAPLSHLELPATAGTGDPSAHAGAAAGLDAAAPWRKLRVLVTAGGTREPLDSVRFLGNSSSGRMGLALAQAARARGAQVTLIAANVYLPLPAGVACREVGTAAELREACVEEFARCDVLLMAAAVADFRPAAPSATKIKKAASHDLVLELEPTVDVLGELTRSRRAGQTLVGFAAEHGADALRDARRKLIDKGLDAIVVNDISREDIGFDAEDNEVTILTAANGRCWRAGRGEHADGSEAHARLARTTQMTVSKAPKLLVAEAILDVVERLRGG